MRSSEGMKYKLGRENKLPSWKYFSWNCRTRKK